MLRQEDVERLKEEMDADYLAEDGLMALEPGAFQDPYPGFTRRTVGNDNGILFAVYYYALIRKYGALGEKYKKIFEQSVRDLEVRDEKGEPVRGLYNRTPGRVKRDEAHDNIRAISAGSAIFGLRFSEEIVEYGLRNGFIYENVKIEKGPVDEHLEERRKSVAFEVFGMDLTRWKQGSTTAVFKLEAGYMPTLWELIWLWGALILSACLPMELDENGNAKNQTSETLLDWLDNEGIEAKAKEVEKVVRWKWVYSVHRLVMAFWQARLLKKTKGRGLGAVFCGYFKDNEPMRRLGDGLLY